MIKLSNIVEQMLSESVDDPSIFKAIFMAGGPGSGKSYIVKKIGLKALGYKLVGSDDIFKYNLDKAGLPATPAVIFSAEGQALRDLAKQLDVIRADQYYDGRLGVVLDSTGKDYNKSKQQKLAHEKMGYDTLMIFVNTRLETAIERDAARDRSLGAPVVTDLWNQVQSNIGKFQNLFGNNFIVIDNNDDSNVEGAAFAAYRKILKWSKQEPKSDAAQAWIKLKKNL
jgi:cytidylate kinase